MATLALLEVPWRPCLSGKELSHVFSYPCRTSFALKNANPVAVAPTKSGVCRLYTANVRRFNYEEFYASAIDGKKNDKSYRWFRDVNRLAYEFPYAHSKDAGQRVNVWCSNDCVC